MVRLAHCSTSIHEILALNLHGYVHSHAAADPLKIDNIPAFHDGSKQSSIFNFPSTKCFSTFLVEGAGFEPA